MNSASNAFGQVERIYERHIDAFKTLEGIFLAEHAIPAEVTRDAIKQRIQGAINGELASEWLVRARGGSIGLMHRAGAMCYLLWCAIRGPHSRKVEVDVLFDGWSPNACEFYSEIINKLEDYSLGAFGLFARNLPRIKSANCFTRNDRPYARKPAWAVFKSYISHWKTYQSLTRKSGIDIFDLALRLSHEIVKHMSSVEGVATKILVSANDNGYSPYRYWLYRSNGVGLLCLIQNGARVELAAFYNCYIYSDYYVGWSRHRLDSFVEMRCNNKIALGSVRLGRFLPSHESDISEDEFDVLFIEQVHVHPTQLSQVYLSFLEHLARYSRENSGRKIAYCLRPGRQGENQASIERIEVILKSGAITIVGGADVFSSYSNIMRAKLVVACDSSMRYEAAVLGKLILSCSDREEAYDYIVRCSAPVSVVSKNDYDTFKNKINYLLDRAHSEEVSEARRHMQELWLKDQQSSISDKIAGLVSAVIGNRSTGMTYGAR